MTLGDVAFGTACFSLGFVLATCMWLWTFRLREIKMTSNQLRMQQNYGMGQGGKDGERRAESSPTK